MASIIQVEELRGLTSGANANTVSMGSGQTFIGSPGQLIQNVWEPATSTFDTTSTSFVTQVSVSFTPKQPGSRVVVQWSGHIYKYQDTTSYNAPAKIMYGSTQIYFTSYFHYTYNGSHQYMIPGAAVGSTISTSATETVSFQHHAGTGGRTYIYANTGGLLIQEFAV